MRQVIGLINAYKPDLVMNIALPYQDLAIMDACLACGVNYMDTANYEPEDTNDPAWRAAYEKRCKEAGFSAYFDYSWQWAYRKKFEGVYLGGGELCCSLRGQRGGQFITLGLCPAGNTQLGEHPADLAAFMDGAEAELQEAGGVSFLQLLEAIRTVCSAHVVGADVNELAPMLDPSGVSTATACKVLRELMLALGKTQF